MKKQTFISLCTGDLKEESCWGIASFKTLYNCYADCSDAEWEKVYNGIQFNTILWNITNRYRDLFCVLMSENCMATLKYKDVEDVEKHMQKVIWDILNNQAYETGRMIAHIGQRKCDKIVLSCLLFELSNYIRCECMQVLENSRQMPWRQLAHSIMHPCSWGEYFVGLVVGYSNNQLFQFPIADRYKWLVDFWSTRELLSSIAGIPFYETTTASEILLDLCNRTKQVVLLWIKTYASLYRPAFLEETTWTQKIHAALHNIFALNHHSILDKQYYTISWVGSVIWHIDEIDDEGNL